MDALAYTLLLAHLATSPNATEQNVCLSPYSLQSAFALVQEGAKGKTKREITRTLHTKDFTALPACTPDANDQGVILEQANSIWINAQNAPHIKSSFLKTNRKRYQAEVESITFDEAGKTQINQWCDEKTHGRISKAIDELNPSEVMELINAIYFKGSWVNEFPARFTQVDDFYTPTPDDAPIQVDMMRHTTHFMYAEDEHCQLIELPFMSDAEGQQDSYALQIVLPKEGTSLLALDQMLSEGYHLPEMDYLKVHLSLPKFELNYSANLVPALREMGMERPFSDEANFSRISSTPLQISSVTQKTFFKVDEKGAEAAAVTAIGMVTTMAPRPEKIHTMKVDHPFLIKLVNTSRNLTLFVGNIFRPERSKTH